MSKKMPLIAYSRRALSWLRLKAESSSAPRPFPACAPRSNIACTLITIGLKRSELFMKDKTPALAPSATNSLRFKALGGDQGLHRPTADCASSMQREYAK